MDLANLETVKVTYAPGGSSASNDHTFTLTKSADGSWIWKEGNNTLEAEPSFEKNYCTLFPLPYKVVDTLPADMEASFYQTLIIEPTYNINTPAEAVRSNTLYFNPHFARTVVNGAAAKPQNPDNKAVSIRTPRHLYGLSFCSKGESDKINGIIGNCYFKQEFDLDFEKYTGWFSESEKTSNVHTLPYSQSGILLSQNNTYDGGCYAIRGVIGNQYVGAGGSAGQSVSGLFSRVGNGCTVQNIVYDMNTDGQVRYEISSGKGHLTAGALVGDNQGTVSNCAVYGADVEFYSDGTSTSVAGGMAGHNSGTVSHCYIELKDLYANNLSVGGLVGKNESGGTIDYCYAVGLSRKAGSSTLAGLAAGNYGTVTNSYAAVRLSGDASSWYGFCRIYDSGTCNGCYWLDGSFRHRGTDYITAPGDYQPAADTQQGGSYIVPDALRTNLNLPEFGQTGNTIIGEMPDDCKGEYEDSEFPYLFTVRDREGDFVHYGPWPVFNTTASGGGTVINEDLPDESGTDLSEPEEPEGPELDTAGGTQDGPGTDLSEPEESEGPELDTAGGTQDGPGTDLSEPEEPEGSELDIAENPQDGSVTDPPAEKPGGTPPALMPESSDKSGLITGDESDEQTAP